MPFGINFECYRAHNDEDQQTHEDDMLERCRTLEVPVQIVHGARDPRPVWAVVKALPRARLSILDGVGHLPWLEEPTAFERVAREFAERVGRYA